MRDKANRIEVMKIIDIINNPDISSEARVMAINMLERLTGRIILTKKDVFKIAKDCEDA